MFELVKMFDILIQRKQTVSSGSNTFEAHNALKDEQIIFPFSCLICMANKNWISNKLYLLANYNDEFMFSFEFKRWIAS